MTNSKNLTFGEGGRKALLNGIKKMGDSVGSTMGPLGRTVLIESNNHLGGVLVTKDGVSVARLISLEDPIENLAIQMMKQAANKTASSAGDGTTTATVLAAAITSEGIDYNNPEINQSEVNEILVKETDKITKELRRKATKMTPKKLLDVATISSNNNRFIGELIAEVYKHIGDGGVVSVENSDTSETYSEVADGIRIDKGFVSPAFVNNQKRYECTFDDCYVLVSDAEISDILQIENVLRPVVQQNKKLVIIAPCSQNFVNSMALNVVKNNVKVCVVQPPSFGQRQFELMDDIALATGAKFFSEKTGDDLSLMTIDDLGSCERAVVEQNRTTLIVNSAFTSRTKERADELKELMASDTVRKGERDFLAQRISALLGKVAVVYVGGKSDIEQKELYDRVEDAVCAVDSALQEGIIPGAGFPLLYFAEKYFKMIENETYATPEQLVAYSILEKALRVPCETIISNAGLNPSQILKEPRISFNFGYNSKTKRYGNLMGMGIIDPVKVTRSALQNAMSVAVTILSTNVIITNNESNR